MMKKKTKLMLIAALACAFAMGLAACGTVSVDSKGSDGSGSNSESDVGSSDTGSSDTGSEAHSHIAGTEWKTDGANHWHECTVCSEIMDEAAHIAGTEWKTDGTNHWHECTVCGEIMDEAAHIAGTEWKTDGTNHWHECTDCGEIMDEAAHTKGETLYSDGITEWYVCTVCGEKLDEVAHTHEYSLKEGVYACVCGDIQTIAPQRAVLGIDADEYGEIGAAEGAAVSFTYPEFIGETFVKAEFNGTALDAGFDGATGVLIVKTAGFGLAYGEQKLSLTFGNGTVELPVLLVTKVLTSKEDFDIMMTIADACEEEENVYGGYFELGADIEYNGVFDDQATMALSTSSEARKGFKGTFDGCGYKVVGVVIGQDSFGNTNNYWLNGHSIFGPLNGGTIKNVSFTKAQVWIKGSLIVSCGTGLIENVYVEYDSIVAWEDGDGNTLSAFFGMGVLPGATVKNTVVDISSTVFKTRAGVEVSQMMNCKLLGQWAILDHVYVVGYRDNVTLMVGGDTEIYEGYAGWNEMRAARLAYEGWDTDFWTIVNGIAVPKALAEERSAVEIALGSNVASAGLGSSFTVNVASHAGYFITLDEESVKAGVTLQGNVVSVPAGIDLSLLSSVTVTVSSVFDEANNKFFTVKLFSVVEKNIETETRILLNLSVSGDSVVLDETTQLSIDLSSLTENIGELDEVSCGDMKIQASLTGKTLVFTPSALGTLYGQKTLVVKTVNGGYMYTINVPVLLVSKVITNAAELNQMGTISKACESAAKLWGGYFELGADIANAGAVNEFITWSLVTARNGSVGFKGVFDGCGYAIDGLAAGSWNAGAFIGYMHNDGIIRNVAFTNASIKWKGGLVVFGGGGLVENVYVQYKSFTYSGSQKMGAFFADNQGESDGGKAIVRNCIVEFAADFSTSGTNDLTKVALAAASNATLENVYCICADETLRAHAFGTAANGDGYGAYASADALKAALANLSVWNSVYWDTSSGIPVFRKKS